MNTKLLLLGFVLATPLFAVDASKILLKGDSIVMEEGSASGAASAVVGDMNISADMITFDKEKSSLKCDGTVTIRVSGSVVTTKGCVIELSAGQKKVYFLSRGEIQISPKEVSYFPISSPDLIGRSADREKLILEVVVMGAVNKPSSVQVGGRLGLLQAIETAKGFTRYADQKSVKVLAGGVKENATIYDVGKIIDGSAKEPDLRAGDVVLVPETK